MKAKTTAVVRFIGDLSQLRIIELLTLPLFCRLGMGLVSQPVGGLGDTEMDQFAFAGLPALVDFAEGFQDAISLDVPYSDPIDAAEALANTLPKSSEVADRLRS